MSKINRIASDYLAVMCTGGIIYGAVELVWRGYTHWTMILLGGLSLVVLYFIDGNIECPRICKCTLGASFITTAEFITGMIVNVELGWEIWDYSDMFMNINGQICPLFSCFWFILCVPGLRLCSYLRKRTAGVRCAER